MKKAVHLQLLRRWTKSYCVLLWSFKVFKRNLFGSLADFSDFLCFYPKSLDFPQFSSLPILPRVKMWKRQAMDIQHSLLTLLLLMVRSNISKEINILLILERRAVALRFLKYIRESKQRRRRRLRKRHLKTEFTLLQNLSRLFHLV